MKRKRVKYEFAQLEYISNNGETNREYTYWAMTNNFEVRLNDEVVFVDLYQGTSQIYRGRVIRRSNASVVKHSEQTRYRIIATANQFPESEFEQTELPVVPVSNRLHETVKVLEDTIIKLRMLL